MSEQEKDITHDEKNSTMEDEEEEEEEKKGEDSTSDTKTNGEDKTDGENEATEGDEEKKGPKVDPKDWPLRGIKDPSDNDVLFGRGGGTNHAKGNKRYRKMVEDRKLEYVNSKRLDKPLVALEIIRLWRAQDPPGRFLKLDSNGTWSDVGDKKAREKTSQALREKAPLIRKQQEEEKLGIDDSDVKDQSTKNTRFAEGTTKESKGGIKKAVLARDHSLGREYLQAGETMNLEGFSWRDPLDPNRTSSTGSLPPPAGYPIHSGSVGMAPPERMGSGRASSGSMSSMGMPPPQYRVPSQGAMPPGPPPPGGYPYRTATEEYGQQPPMPGYSGYGPHVRTGSWAHNAAHAMPIPREHSLSQNPLRNASATHTAPLDAFGGAGRSGSGYWGGPPPPPPQQPYGSQYRQPSGPRPHPPPHNYNPPVPSYPMMQAPPQATSSSRPYAVDVAIAQSWSGNSDEDISKMYEPKPQTKQQPSGGFHVVGFDDDRVDQSDLPRPDIVKRMTSNQNETPETKKDLVGIDRSVKRCALNRDSSLASNRLKKQQFPDQFKNGKFDPVQEMNTLASTMEQSSLGATKPAANFFGAEGRSTTIERLAADMMTKPLAINETSRVSTIEALELDDLETDPAIAQNGDTASIPKPSALGANNRVSTMDACLAELEEVTAKPMALTGSDRVSTRDFLDLGAEPLSEVDFEKLHEEAV